MKIKQIQPQSLKDAIVSDKTRKLHSGCYGFHAQQIGLCADLPFQLIKSVARKPKTTIFLFGLNLNLVENIMIIM